MRWTSQPALMAIVILLLSLRAASQPRFEVDPNFTSIESRYYVIYTDIDPGDMREAVIRMTKMAEEYHYRTQDFSGAIRDKLPFVLFRNPDDYYAAGGKPGTAGVFTGAELMAIAGERAGKQTWHVVQHEGFHQFAHAVIGRGLPIWVNEGLAEYFGESIFTGDGFVTGAIPPHRLVRIQKGINNNFYRPMQGMMMLTQEQWNNEMSAYNYDQAWSMVQFLEHGDDGKYQKAFTAYKRSLSKGRDAANAWKETLGDVAQFEQQWRKYWLELSGSPTADLYARAATSAFTSYLGRAYVEKQTFEDFQSFRAASDAGELKINDKDWLPPNLIREFTRQADDIGRWSIEQSDSESPRIVCETKSGSRLFGSFTVRSDRIERVEVFLDDSMRVLAEARKLIELGRKDSARTMIERSLRENPASPNVDALRKMLAEIRS